MNKQPTTIRTYLLRGAFLLSLAFVIVMPLALGQRQPLAPGQRQSADTILQHFKQQAPQQAPLFVPMPPAGVIDCDNQPGIIIHDDGGIENGYSGNPFLVSEVRFVDSLRRAVIRPPSPRSAWISSYFLAVRRRTPSMWWSLMTTEPVAVRALCSAS